MLRRVWGRRSIVALGAGLATLHVGAARNDGAKASIVIESDEAAELAEGKPSRHYPFVVVGAATAAHAAIEAILQQAPGAEILMISEEAHLARADTVDEHHDAGHSADDVHRPIADALMDSYNEWRRYITPRLDDNHARASVSLVLGKQNMAFDVENKLITLPDTTTVSYGTCLIATAGKPKPLYVLDSSKISYALRDRINVATTASDFAALDRLSARRDVRRVTVVGGGFLGTEIAVALATDPRNAHLEVHQMFVDGHGPCARHLPAYLSKELTERVTRLARVRVQTNTLVTSVKAGASGQVLLACMGAATGAHETDYAILAATQIEPNVGVGAFIDGIEIDPVHGGIVVNAQLEAARDLYVAGSVASYYDSFVGRRRVDRFDHAVNSGLLAGQNMVNSVKKVYRHQPMFRSHMPAINVTCEGIGEIDSRLQTIGVWLVPPAPFAAPASSTPFARGVVYYVRGNKVVGILLWNAPDLLETARNVMVHKPTFESVGHLTKVISLGPTDWLDVVATDEAHHVA